MKMVKKYFSNNVINVHTTYKYYRIRNQLFLLSAVGSAIFFTYRYFNPKEQKKSNKKSFLGQKYTSVGSKYEKILRDVDHRDYEFEPIFTSEFKLKNSENFQNSDLDLKSNGNEGKSVDNGGNLNENFRVQMEKMVLRAQHRIALALFFVEGKHFERDVWTRKDGSGVGVVRYIQNGNKLEKGGINVTVSNGNLTEEVKKQLIRKNETIHKFIESNKGEIPFFSASISSVIHPLNPHAPTVHFNYRYFEVGENDSEGNFIPRHWWFGGGCDLTPSVLYEEDCKDFHSVYKKVCDNHRPGDYRKFKKDCDDYFYIPYRDEHRGIGGVFFDGLTGDREEVFNFVEEMANSFIEAYVPILLKRSVVPFSKEERIYQAIRRGRYAEFNFVVDRGTKFGRVRENANIEAIHISLPLHARFEYNRKSKRKDEIELEKVLKAPVDWV